MKLTKENFKELLLTVMAGVWVRSALAELKGTNLHSVEQWEDYFAKMAKQLGYDELTEIFKDKLIPHNDLCLESEKEMEEYNDDTFWFELEIRLGKRDFNNDATDEELSEIEKHNWFPEKIHKYYNEYRKEFKKHGISRLKIIKSKK